MEPSGRNRTPDKLGRKEKEPLFEACDEAFGAALDVLCPKHVIGVGAFAEKRARHVLERIGDPEKLGRIPHPSPASPLANRDWAGATVEALRECGVKL